MKIEVSSKMLLDAAKKAATACGGTSAMADMIKISCKGEKITLTAVGDPMTIVTNVDDPDASVKEDGEFLIEKEILLSALKKSDGNIITMTTDKRNGYLSVSDGKAKMKLNITNTDDFPKAADSVETNLISIAKDDLVDMLKKTVYASAVKDNRAILNGGHVVVGDGLFKICCTDSYRLAVQERAIDTGEAHIETTVPIATLKAILTLFEGEENIQISCDDRRAAFSCDNFRIISRLLSGAYPRVLNLIPEETAPTTAKSTMKRKRLLEAVDRCSILKDEGACILLLNGKEGEPMTVSSKDQEIGSASDSVPCEWVGDEFEISMDARYVKDALKAMDQENITMNFYGNIRPAVIRDGNEIHLLLPVRTRS